MKIRNVMITLAFTTMITTFINVKTAHAADSNMIWKLHTGTALQTVDNNWEFQLGDYNRDGVQDLYCIDKANTGTKTTEVHVLDGKNNYKAFSLHTGTSLNQTDSNWIFKVGDYNNDGYPDLYCISRKGTGSSTTEVHVLSGKDNFKTFLLHTTVPLGQTDDNYDFELGDYNRDGVPDLYCIKKSNTGTKSSEVHVLDGRSNYQTFTLHTGTPLECTDNNWEFGVGDYNEDGVPDLYCMKKANTGSKSTEIHILDGKSNYQNFTLHSGSPLGETDNKFTMLVGKGKLNIYAIQRAGTGSNTTEVHEFGYKDEELGSQIVAYAKNFIGTPYKYGGESPSGFDCSGFTKYVFAHFGITLNRVAQDQAKQGRYIPKDQLQPGDLVFFGTSSNIHHVGIYVGGGNFIDSPHTGAYVRIEPLFSDYYTARRVG